MCDTIGICGISCSTSHSMLPNAFSSLEKGGFCTRIHNMTVAYVVQWVNIFGRSGLLIIYDTLEKRGTMG